MKSDIINKIHLIISIIIVVPTAIIYGFQPDLEFDIYLYTIDEKNAFKAFTGLYLSFSILWILGILKPKYLRVAITSNIIFMLGLGAGRFLSLLLDGTPTSAFIIGLIGEFILGFYGVWVLKYRLKNDY